MPSPNKWQPKEPLEWSDRTLLPNLHLRWPVLVAVEFVWALIAVSLHAVRGDGNVPASLISWLFAAWLLVYIFQRLRGARATLVAFVHVDSESVFQHRLIVDTLVIVLLLFQAALLALGSKLGPILHGLIG